MLGIVAAVLVGGWLSARPAWRWVKAVRAQRFLAESETFIQQEEWTRALERTRSALQLAPAHPTVLRHAAELHGRFGSEGALTYYEQLLATGKATVSDREQYAAVAFGLGDAGLAGALIEELLSGSRLTARTLLLGAQYRALQQQPAEAIRLARECLKVEPGNPTNALALGTFLSTSPREADREEAMTVLWPYAEADGPLRMRALATIVRAPDTPRADREKAEALLRGKESRTVDEELLRLEAAVSLDPSMRVRAAEEVMERIGRSSPEAMAAAAHWLNRQEQFARTVALVLPDVARTHPRLTQLRYEALVGLGQDRAAYDFIRADGVPGDAVALEFLRCAAAARLKDEAAVDGHLRNLLTLTRRQPRQMRAVAEFALRHRRTEIATEANRILSRHPREAEAAFRSLLRTAATEGETWAARDYARKLAALRPDDESVRLQVAYYDLLLEEEVDRAFAAVEGLHRERPRDFQRRVALALGHLRRGEPERAGALIEGQMVVWRDLPPSARAVVVATLGANGRESSVARLLPRVPLARLHPEERELLRPHLAGAMSRGMEEPGDGGAEEL